MRGTGNYRTRSEVSEGDKESEKGNEEMRGTLSYRTRSVMTIL